MLVGVHRILAPGGQVWISCPNSQSRLRKMFGRFWINWHVPFHISHFSSETLKQLLESSGFTSVSIRQVTPALWVSMSIIARLFARQGRPTRELRNPIFVTGLLFFVRFFLFPLLWLQNRAGRGDCLLVTAIRA